MLPGKHPRNVPISAPSRSLDPPGPRAGARSRQAGTCGSSRTPNTARACSTRPSTRGASRHAARHPPGA
eukprot:3909708-Prymnesium_polylepis.1